MFHEHHGGQPAGLRAPSYFRLYLVTLSQPDGRLSDPDWRSVLTCFRLGLGDE